MTSFSIILMVPTLIASFYGMNVKIHAEFELNFCANVAGVRRVVGDCAEVVDRKSVV